MVIKIWLQRRELEIGYQVGSELLHIGSSADVSRASLLVLPHCVAGASALIGKIPLSGPIASAGYELLAAETGAILSAIRFFVAAHSSCSAPA